MTRNEAPATTNYYTLSKPAGQEQKPSFFTAVRRFSPVLAEERGRVAVAFAASILSSGSGLLGPVIIGRTVDVYIQNGNFTGVLQSAALLLGVYLCGLAAAYVQTQTMGTVGRNVLFKLRNALFTKLQELPLVFFNQNKAGDLISRINNDTDKLNVFFAQSLVQLAGNLFMMTGAGIFLVALNIRLGVAALLPGLGVLVFSRLVSGWVKSRSVKSLQSLGGMSGEIQESLSSFKVIVAFNRTDYFRRKFDEANERNFSASVGAGLASGMFMPVYGLAHNLGQLAVLSYGMYLISAGNLTLGLLIGFLLYTNSFYLPLRQLGTVWSAFQMAMAAFDRISEVLALESNMPVIPASPAEAGAVLEFQNVRFSYPGGKDVLRDASFRLARGKTYALVGPTGGGKTTTASLMARLYDPINGCVLLEGRDIRSYPPEERARRIGFILQEPFLFTGTIRDNILYGNERYKDNSNEKLLALLKERNLDALLSRFEQGLDTPVTAAGDSVSLGQKQLIAFMRAVLRDPEILILDEATANIDTVTEQLLEQVLDKLPGTATKVIIAHRLNTIASADEIFFINSGEIQPAGSMEQALDMLLHGKRET